MKRIAIIGPTASGKSALSLQIAQRFSGEIICADSRTVYKEMNIGTAKPSAVEQALVPHYGLDIVAPNERFTVHDFKQMAQSAARSIESRSNRVMIVGGTGLYVDALLYDFNFRPVLEGAVNKYAGLTLRALQQEAKARSIDLNASDWGNSRRLVAALLAETQANGRQNVDKNTIIIGLLPDIEVLEQRIAMRTKEWMLGGLPKEALSLFKKYGAVEPLNTSPYKELIDTTVEASEVEQLINTHLRQIAKRQITWFKRNPDIVWYQTPEAAFESVALQLEREV